MSSPLTMSHLATVAATPPAAHKPAARPTSPYNIKSLHTSRRLALGLTSGLLLGLSWGPPLLADEGIRWWSDGPLMMPSVENKIANEATGTRAFLKEGVYIADIPPEARMFRLYKTSFDLLAMGDLIGKDAWPYIRRYLRLKSTFMYYDFDRVISAAPVNDKKPLTDLANRLFNSFEELLVAVKKHDLPNTESCYKDTSVILEEVMARMA